MGKRALDSARESCVFAAPEVMNEAVLQYIEVDAQCEASESTQKEKEAQRGAAVRR